MNTIKFKKFSDYKKWSNERNIRGEGSPATGITFARSNGASLPQLNCKGCYPITVVVEKSSDSNEFGQYEVYYHITLVDWDEKAYAKALKKLDRELRLANSMYDVWHYQPHRQQH